MSVASRACALGFSLAVALGTLALLWGLTLTAGARWTLGVVSAAAWVACASLFLALRSHQRQPPGDALVAHLHDSFDQERERIASELHDDLGSTLIAAKMTVELAGRELPPQAPGLAARFTSIQDALRSALALERRLADQLYPSLLRHIGLFAALRGHLTCAGENPVTVTAPERERGLSRQFALSVYRIAEASVRGLQSATRCGPIDVQVTESSQWLELRFAASAPAVNFESAVAAEPELAVAAARVHRMGGDWTRSNGATGVEILIRLPLTASE